MWSNLDCFLCCKKLLSKSNNDSYLLHKQVKNETSSNKNDDVPQGRTENYMVRRVSRFGGTIPLDNFSDREHKEKHHSNSDTNIHNTKDTTKETKLLIKDKKGVKKSDSGLWECPSVCSIEKSSENVVVNVTDADTTPQKHSWHTSLQEKTQKLLHHKHRNPSPISSSLAVSTPDLSIPLSGNETRVTKAASPFVTKRVVTAASTLQVTNPTLASTWLKSQSMMNVANISSAKDYGLDVSLYPPAPMRTAVSTPRELNQPVASAGTALHKREELLPEMSHGLLHFTASFSDGKLLVHISQIDDLPLKGAPNRTYTVILRLSILPNDSKTSSTKTSKTARDSRTPCRFQEDFELPLEGDVSGRTLRISVLDTSLRGKYDAVGHALFALDDDELQSQPSSFQLKLFKQSEPLNSNMGALMTTLSYDQREKKISLLAMQCRELRLPIKGSKVSADKYTTYVKASLYCKGQKMKSKKSNVISNEKDPFYNHLFQFRVVPEVLAESCLSLSVVLKSRLKQDTTIGKVILGPHFYTEGSNMTPWGRVVLGQQTASHWYRLYL